MNFFIPLGDFAPAAVPLLVLAIAWAMIWREQRRRRLRKAAGLPIFGPAVRPEGAEGAGLVRQPLALSREVVEHFRAMGPGWQARIDEVLKRHVRDEEDRARQGAVEEVEGKTARVAEERSGYDAGAGEGGREAGVTTVGIISVVFLAVLVVLILRGIRGHGHDDKSGADSAGGPDDAVGGGD